MRRFPAPLEWTGYFKENTVDDRVVRPGYVRRPRLYMFTLNTHRWLLIVNNICKVIYLRVIYILTTVVIFWSAQTLRVCMIKQIWKL